MMVCHRLEHLYLISIQLETGVGSIWNEILAGKLDVKTRFVLHLSWSGMPREGYI